MVQLCLQKEELVLLLLSLLGLAGYLSLVVASALTLEGPGLHGLCPQDVSAAVEFGLWLASDLVVGSVLCIAGLLLSACASCCRDRVLAWSGRCKCCLLWGGLVGLLLLLGLTAVGGWIVWTPSKSFQSCSKETRVSRAVF
jgi:hypothetical protein